MNQLSSLQPEKPALTIPSAFKAWSHWVARLDGGGYQANRIKQHADKLTRAETLLFLAELFSRAQMELAIGLYCDRMDSRVDVLVREQIRELFGAEVLAEVVELVASIGPVHKRR